MSDIRKSITCRAFLHFCSFLKRDLLLPNANNLRQWYQINLWSPRVKQRRQNILQWTIRQQVQWGLIFGPKSIYKNVWCWFFLFPYLHHLLLLTLMAEVIIASILWEAPHDRNTLGYASLSMLLFHIVSRKKREWMSFL